MRSSWFYRNTHNTSDLLWSKQLDKTRDNTTVYDSLYSLNTAIGKVGESPAGITNHLLVRMGHQEGQSW